LIKSGLDEKYGNGQTLSQAESDNQNNLNHESVDELNFGRASHY